MRTQPRMSAPIGRLEIRTSKARKRRTSGTGRWSPAEPAVEGESNPSGETPTEESKRRYYPFAPSSRDDGHD
jgi:hypothetical protein